MNELKTAVFGGGCFWCMEAVFDRLKGVESVASGFSGGEGEVTYEEMHARDTGHAEVVKVEYDPSIIDYDTLLSVFFGTHDPTTLNRQGHDVGEEYRSAIFYMDDDQKDTAEAFIQKLTNEGTFEKPIVTQVEPFQDFYPAGKEHQQYYEKNTSAPYCQIVINPKLAKLREKFAPLLKRES